jgi:hypothetical protein
LPPVAGADRGGSRRLVAIGTAFALAGRSAQALLAGEAVDRTVPALPLENEHGA